MTRTALGPNTCPITKFAKHTTAHQKLLKWAFALQSHDYRLQVKWLVRGSCMMHGARQGLGSVADTYLDTTAICLVLLLLRGNSVLNVTTIALL